MSEGTVICSKCRCEVFQMAPGARWVHSDLLPLCRGADAVYPNAGELPAERKQPTIEMASIFTDKDYRNAMKPKR